MAGGFDEDEFVGSVDDNLQCPICCKVLRDPRSCNEGHTFCHSCISQWLRTTPSCPTCKSVLTGNGLTNNRVVQNLIGRLSATCPNRAAAHADGASPSPKRRRTSSSPAEQEQGEEDRDEEEGTTGCDWVGPHSERDTHARISCPFQMVRCAHAGCGKALLRRDLVEHKLSCVYRQVQCDKCAARMTSREVKRHETECPRVEVGCAHGCGVRFPRSDTADHTKVCPHVPVLCGIGGCTARPARKDLEAHKAANSLEHVRLLRAQVAELRRERGGGDQKAPLQAQETVMWKIDNFVAKAKAGLKVLSRSVAVGPVRRAGTYTMGLSMDFKSIEGKQTPGLYFRHYAGPTPVHIRGSTVTLLAKGTGLKSDVTRTTKGWGPIPPTCGFGWDRFATIESLQEDGKEELPESITVMATIQVKAPPVEV